MTDKQLVFKDDEIIRILNNVYNLFKAGQFDEALENLEKALKIDFEYPGITLALKSATFWKQRKERLAHINNDFERGEYLFSQWKHFLEFIANEGEASEKCIFNIKQYVFHKSLEAYISLYNESSMYDADLLLRIGKCYKAIGNYDKAVEFLETATHHKSGSSQILAELADCYALVNEERASKIFFREAFFLNPQEIDIESIESVAIQRLVDKLKSMKLEESELKEWISVYGIIYGIFNIKRELRPIEIGKLKQSIYQMEQTLEEETNKDKKIIIPRLLNHYFWLIDYYIYNKEEKTKLDEILAKIKKLSPEIYREYIK